MEQKVLFTFVLVNIAIASAYIITKSNIGNMEISTIYNSIEDFQMKNPDIKIIEMETHDNPLNASRSYTLGSRQTGNKNCQKL